MHGVRVGGPAGWLASGWAAHHMREVGWLKRSMRAGRHVLPQQPASTTIAATTTTTHRGCAAWRVRDARAVALRHVVAHVLQWGSRVCWCGGGKRCMYSCRWGPTSLCEWYSRGAHAVPGVGAGTQRVEEARRRSSPVRRREELCPPEEGLQPLSTLGAPPLLPPQCGGGEGAVAPC